MKTTIQRLPAVMQATGLGRSTTYQDIADGLMTPPIKLGPRSVGWPSHEVQALIHARIAGASDEQLRRLVAKLVADRAKLLAEVAG